MDNNANIENKTYEKYLPAIKDFNSEQAASILTDTLVDIEYLNGTSKGRSLRHR